MKSIKIFLILIILVTPFLYALEFTSDIQSNVTVKYEIIEHYAGRAAAPTPVIPILLDRIKIIYNETVFFDEDFNIIVITYNATNGTIDVDEVRITLNNTNIPHESSNMRKIIKGVYGRTFSIKKNESIFNITLNIHVKKGIKTLNETVTINIEEKTTPLLSAILEKSIYIISTTENVIIDMLIFLKNIILTYIPNFLIILLKYFSHVLKIIIIYKWYSLLFLLFIFFVILVIGKNKNIYK